VRLLVLGDVLTALEGRSAPLAVVLVGRHRRFLQARTCSWAGPHTRHARQADLDCTPGGGFAHRNLLTSKINDLEVDGTQ
jgi:hypothetical protein